MDRCQYCGFAKGGHDTNCPHPSPTLDRPRRMTPELEEWGRGYRDGRAGWEPSTKTSPAYQLGYTKGEAALEEAGNSYQPFGAPA